MTKEWRERWTAAQHRGRTIERQAGGLRIALIAVADGKPPEEALRAIQAMREQLEVTERLVATLARRGAP
jgi:hypothetical protein